MPRTHRPSWPLITACGVVAVLVLSMLLPYASISDGPRRKANLGSNMRQVTLAMICYASDSGPSGNAPSWPTDDRDLIAWSDGELVAKIFSDPQHPDIRPAWIYIRPARNPNASQPVLVADPRCSPGRGSLIAYADGRIGHAGDPSAWDAAVALSRTAEAQTDGFTTADWAAAGYHP